MHSIMAHQDMANKTDKIDIAAHIVAKSYPL